MSLKEKILVAERKKVFSHKIPIVLSDTNTLITDKRLKFIFTLYLDEEIGLSSQLFSLLFCFFFSTLHSDLPSLLLMLASTSIKQATRKR